MLIENAMRLQVLLLLSLAATDILIGVQALGVFWLVFVMVAIPIYRSADTRGTSETVRLRWVLCMVLVAMAVSGLSSATSKPSSMVYAATFLVYGFWLIASLGSFGGSNTAKAMRIIIGAYFCSALVAILFKWFGIEGIENFLFTRLWINTNAGEARPVGFTSEPSYAAFIIVLAWMSLVRLNEIRPGARNGFGFWTGLTFISLQLYGSIYGYLLGLVVALTSLSLLPKPTRLLSLVGGALLSLFVILFVSMQSEEARSFRILTALISGDLETWLIEDTSSFFRFGPLFGYITSANFKDISTWLGHGATSGSYFFTDMFRLHIDAEKDGIELGLMPAFIYDYGFIAGVLFLGFLYRTTQGPFRPAMIAIIVLLIFNANFSTQMMWFAITCALLSSQSMFRVQSPR